MSFAGYYNSRCYIGKDSKILQDHTTGQ